ncbi:MAG TPA: D-glycero-beta-D-manno-heptose-7-phosphate kinase [Ideonella sp.]|uniref:D-glycero-beta-D-manno-heptose-7-phosphate kinase n=1 Tax=Ideonella sp. TaxID=1929293 RepID=UPI002CE8BCAA|nr:D-glycero-beta-D-manno-heptose-7-phosphate kinase [Ideonella sp.]HSI48424.1 D-glycero-beta-D-manno-heptose-7-phosphate kinase [Ideonella sp.]
MPMTVPDKSRLAKSRVLVVGDAMLDRYWFGDVERISPEAPVPVVRVTREEDRLGGAANVALNVRRLGVSSTLMTVVGEDAPAAALERLLEREGVSTLLGRDAQLMTVVKLRVIGRAQQLMRVDFENKPDHEVLAQMLVSFEKALADCDAILFSDYGKGGLTHIPRMIELARKAGKPVLVDPKGSDYARYADATVLTPNRAELAEVVGRWHDEADLEQRAQSLRHKLGLEALLLTRSEEGMTLFTAGARLDVPAQALEVFDVTGAGDTVIATLAAMLACGVGLRDAVPIANRAGSIVVGKFGTASVSYEELFA